jgi:hypothetical protein
MGDAEIYPIEPKKLVTALSFSEISRIYMLQYSRMASLYVKSVAKALRDYFYIEKLIIG